METLMLLERRDDIARRKLEDFLNKVPKGVPILIANYSSKSSYRLPTFDYDVKTTEGRSNILYHPTHDIRRIGNLYIAEYSKDVTITDKDAVSYFAGAILDDNGKAIPIGAYIHYKRNKSLENLVSNFIGINVPVYETKTIATVFNGIPQLSSLGIFLANKLAESGQGVTSTEVRRDGYRPNIFLNYHKVLDLTLYLNEITGFGESRILPYINAYVLGHEALHALVSSKSNPFRGNPEELAIEEGLAHISGILFSYMLKRKANDNTLSDKEFLYIMGIKSKLFGNSIKEYYPKAYKAKNPSVYYEVGTLLEKLGDILIYAAQKGEITQDEIKRISDTYVKGLASISIKYGLSFNPLIYYRQLNVSASPYKVPFDIFKQYSNYTPTLNRVIEKIGE